MSDFPHEKCKTTRWIKNLNAVCREEFLLIIIALSLYGKVPHCTPWNAN